MATYLYSIYFDCFDEYKKSLELIATARIATTGLHSEASLRLEVFNWHDDDLMRLLIDASSKAGRTMLRIYTALLDYEVGPENFTVCLAEPKEIRKVEAWKRGQYDG